MPVNLPRRRLAASLLAPVLAIGALQLGAVAPAHAADPLVVLGTSDVSDSGLITYLAPKILADTGVTVQYKGSASQAAITSAMNGEGSALIVHAASLENQFVAPTDGHTSYSLEPAGRSLMWGDFILAGDKADPAQVKSNGSPSHNVVEAFHKIAKVGSSGGAHFISRAGGPGTTVQEHAIWEIVDKTYGGDIPMCLVSQKNGLGLSPSSPALDGQPCPTAPTANDYPSWYNSSGRSQGVNVTFADACVIPPSGVRTADCYVLTDRGTYQNLASAGSVPNLTVAVRNNDLGAPGGAEALVNAFHAYAINPAAVANPSAIDTVQAKKFLDWMTSPTGQAAINAYQPEDPSFLPAAAPVVTLSSKAPPSTQGSTPFSVTGHLADAIPGYPLLSNMPVRVLGAPTSNPNAKTVVASGTTDAAANFSIPVTPNVSMTYTVDVPQATRVQNATLNPPFLDILQGTSGDFGASSVNGLVSGGKAKKNHKGRKLRVSGNLNPAAGPGATMVLYRAKITKKGKGKSKALVPVASKPLPVGSTTYRLKFKFKKGKWKYVLVYQNPGSITSVATPVRKVTFR